MSIIINTNISSMLGVTALNKNTNAMNKALERLSTGCRINSVKDDAAGSAISTSLTKEVSSFKVAQNNAQMGQSMLDTANGSLSNIANLLQRVRDLAEQSANGAYGTSERIAMQTEVNNLSAEMTREAAMTEFNGKNLLAAELEHVIVTEEVPLTEPELIALRVDYAESLGYVGVTNAQQLKTALTTDADCKVMLCTNIDLAELGEDWEAVGTSGDAFKGILDGNGFTISNLTINKSDTDYQGLFGYADHATIRNVKLDNVNVTGKDYTGSLVGYANNYNEISNCEVYGDITGHSYVGGIAGYNNNHSTIDKCYVSINGKVTNSNLAGITSGNYSYSTVSNCSVTGTLTGSSNTRPAAGIVGANYSSSTVSNCTSTCSFAGPSWSEAGIVGNMAYSSSIINCKTTSVLNKGGTVRATVLAEYHSGTLSGNEYNPTINDKVAPVGRGLTPTDEQILANENLVIDPSKPAGIGVIPYDDPIKTKIVTHEKTITNSTNFNLQVGINNDADSIINIDTGIVFGSLEFDISTENNARIALAQIDLAMSKVTQKMTDIGSMSSRLDSAMQYQQIQKNTKYATNSIIKDADFAAESSNYIKQQILQQTTSSLLSTANQNPSIALMLLGR